ncbi:zinc finger, CCHC-type containing protein [Tanacetum coccineum]
MEMNLTQLCDLDPMNHDTKILVRCISIWKSHPLGKPNEVWSLDAILQDQQGKRVQVSIKGKHISKFQLIPDEGAYVIGTVVSVSDAIPFNNYGKDQLRRTIILEDVFSLSYMMRESQWGRVVMILQLCKVKYFNGSQGLRGSRKLKPGALSLYVGDGHRAGVKSIGEFHLCLPKFLDHLKEHEIIAHHTPPYTPQHNGMSERRNRTLLDMVRSMMSQTTLSKSFWDYAIESVARILNMVPTKKALQVMGTGCRLFLVAGPLFMQFLGASFIQGMVSGIPIVGSISPEGFLTPILLLVVIIVTVVIVAVILVVVVVAIVGVVIVVAIIGVVVVFGGVSFIIKLSFVII